MVWALQSRLLVRKTISRSSPSTSTERHDAAQFDGINCLTGGTGQGDQVVAQNVVRTVPS